jgi:hypothetical protein
MAHHPIHKIGARWAVPALLLVLGALLEVGCDKDSPEVTTSESSLTPLWEGESKDLEEWQLLKSPSHIIMGPPGELFISTERQGTVVRCSTEGHLVEVIGGKGEGPGEFQSTGDMVFDGQSSILWVSDAASRNRIISRFKIKSRHSEYLGRFDCGVVSEGIPATSLADAHSIWRPNPGTIDSIDGLAVRISESGSIVETLGKVRWTPSVGPFSVRLKV